MDTRKKSIPMRKITAALLTVLITVWVIIPVSAVEVDALTAQLAEKEQEIAVNKELIQSLQSEKKAFSDTVISIHAELQETQAEIERLNSVLEEIQGELAVAQGHEDEKRGVFHTRLRVMYESGMESNTEKILDSDDIMTATRKAEIIRQISEYDKALLDEMSAVRMEIDERKKQYQETIEEQNRLTEDLNASLEANNAEIEQLDLQIAEAQATQTRLESEKQKIAGELYKQTYGGKIEEEGKKYLGYPYVWGGSTPETSFDCSGFVCWVLNHSGVYKIGRTTAQGIYDQCVAINKEDAQPGDIIFFTKTYNSGVPVSHVGFYVGDNRMLHCGSPIQYARIDVDYWRSHFYAFGRLKTLK